MLPQTLPYPTSESVRSPQITPVVQVERGILVTQTSPMEALAAPGLGIAVRPFSHLPYRNSIYTEPPPGSTVAYCGTGCQGSYGSCFGKSAPATKKGCLWTVPGAGGFTQFANYTFQNTATSPPSGLMASNYIVADSPGTPTATYNHSFIPADVTVSGGFLQLKVPGGQTQSPLKCAEVVTTLSDIHYASVRTTAIFSSVAGTVNGKYPGPK